MNSDKLQAHVLSRPLELPARAKELGRQLRNTLRSASDGQLLRTSPSEIFKLIEVLPEPPPGIVEQLRERELHTGAYCIVGGDKNFKRDRNLRHFARNDDAWFDFTVTVREGSEQLELLAYDFEIRFPHGSGTPFLRFDLNLPSHRNEDRELRSHMHPGSDDVIVPAPMMTPVELIELFVHALRCPTDRKQRAPTAFEIGWFQGTAVLFTPP